MSAPQRQLKMRRPDLDRLPPLDMTAGYALRTWLPGDEQAWADIMNTGIGEGWTVELVQEKFTTRPSFIPDAVFFATYAGQPVGTATAWRVPETETQQGYVHMVCVLPEHRGHNLGYLTTLATLHWFKQHSFTYAILETDDFRLPAIKAYLRLGFAPVIEPGYDDMRQRWEKIMQEMSQTRNA